MAKVLVSILSDNLIANFLFYKEKQSEFDSQIFITTSKMKENGVGVYLETAMGIVPNSVRRIEVPNDSYAEVIEKLKSEGLSYQDEYWINQTGGTKAMSIAIFVFFQNLKSHFVYLPIGGKAFLDMLNKDVTYPVTYNTTLFEYLSLYGIKYESKPKMTRGKQQLYDLFNKVKRDRWVLPYNLRCADTYYQNPEDKIFYKGAWFEEFSYLLVKSRYGLSDRQIAVSAKLYRKDSLVNDNEIDVMYVKDNILNIIECKVAMNGGGNPRNTVYEYMYKLAAIAKDLGLRVNAYIFTLHNMYSFSEVVRSGFDKRMKILGLKGIYDGFMLDDMTKQKQEAVKEEVKKEVIKEEKESVITHKSASNTSQKKAKKEKLKAALAEWYLKTGFIAKEKEKEKKKEIKVEKEEEVYKTEKPTLGIKVVGHIDLSQFKKK